jgi:hypothetical protein
LIVSLIFLSCSNIGFISSNDSFKLAAADIIISLAAGVGVLVFSLFSVFEHPVKANRSEKIVISAMIFFILITPFITVILLKV